MNAPALLYHNKKDIFHLQINWHDETSDWWSL